MSIKSIEILDSDEEFPSPHETMNPTKEASPNKIFGLLGTGTFANFSKNLAKEQFGESVEKVQSSIQLGNLRDYFAVNNFYVFKKIIRILFPYRKKNWARKMSINNQGENSFFLPNEDENAPDLYIPLFSFITYVLLLAVFFGFSNPAGEDFSPEIILKTTSSSMALFGAEFLVTKIGLQLGKIELSSFETAAFLGYKFVPIVLNLLIFAILGRIGYYISWLVTSASFVLFLRRSLTNRSSLKFRSDGLSPSMRGMAMLSVFESFLQPLLCFVFGLF